MSRLGAVLGVFICSSAMAATLYVDLNSSSPTPPYASWATAATNIQDAIDSAGAGDEVLVADGLYNTGSRVAPGQVLCGNRVVIDKTITVRSVNGAESAIIEGQGPRGDTAIRGVWMADGALLDGFTITNGHTTVISANDDDGGGVYCTSTNALIENSIIISNSARYAGGSYYGTLNNCTISGNSASFGDGGGMYYGTLNNCTISGNSASFGDGGGMYRGTASDSTISGNIASSSGGGSYYGTLNNCAISGNVAKYSGGGSYGGTLNNCTISSNSASSGGGSYNATLNDCTISGNAADRPNNTQNRGGGSYGGTLNNCTISSNTTMYDGGGSYYGTLNNCTISGNSTSAEGDGSYGGMLKNCIIYGNGSANISGSANLSICYTNDPHFVSVATGNYRLAADSPCRDAGLNAFVTTTSDLDGNPRIVNGTVDMGAYEYQGTNLYFITASAGSHGSITPSGKVNALAGTNIAFTITPDPYYQTADVSTNGVPLGLTGATTYTWNSVNADGILNVTFAERTTTNNIPEWWLAQYGWTTDFELAALADTDGDGYTAGDEYVLGFNPTDPLSTLGFSAQSINGACRLSFLTVAGRTYIVEYSNDLTSGGWSEYFSFDGIGGEVNLNDSAPATKRFYRVKVDRL